MHHAATTAYAKVAQATLSPRDLEASLLMKAAYRLQAIRENWEAARPELPAALTYNRKLWTILATAATEADNPLPEVVKTNVAQIAAVIFQRTLSVMAEPAPEKLTLLVNINREIAAGLRAMPQAA